MSSITEVRVGNFTIRVADIKKKYIQNIADAAADCDYIDRVVLFGSSIRNNCKESSDIDLAVFGSRPKGRTLTSAGYRRFLEKLSAFDDFKQTYDVLYFKSGSRNNSAILSDIEKGEVIYAK